MPTIGASQFYAARFTEDEFGRISYLEGIRAARLAAWNLNLNNTDVNNDYLDNAVAENAGGEFNGGDLSVEVGEFTQPASRLVLGAKTGTIRINGKDHTGVIMDDSVTRPFIGCGYIKKQQIHNKLLWIAIVLLKVRFTIPNEAVQTQGETISWQHDTISGSVQRTGQNGAWQIHDQFASESAAAAYIRSILNIESEELEELTVTSEAGEESGKTSIEVNPEIMEGRTYRYKTGDAVAIPTVNEDLSSWTVWDGVSEITGTTGDQIVIAEVDVENKAMAAGRATITAKD